MPSELASRANRHATPPHRIDLQQRQTAILAHDQPAAIGQYNVRTRQAAAARNLQCVAIAPDPHDAGASGGNFGIDPQNRVAAFVDDMQRHVSIPGINRD